ncbi:MAG: DUF4198 domain-containing protein [Acidobacteriales bacterium]|nr:DUF4198 domain-containing protein [Terriglobales bacterium]
MKAIILKSSSVCLALLVSTAALGHDLYLVTGVRGAEGKICARIGEDFPESENAVTPDRLTRFAVRTSNGSKDLQAKVSGKQLCAIAPSQRDFIAEMVVQPRFIKLGGRDFNEYIEGEGLKAVMQSRANDGPSADGRELYSRYSKVIAGKADAHAVLGHTLEIVLEKDPAAMKPGEALPVRVLFKGKPLADAQVAAVYAGAKLKGHKFPVATRTDSEGRAALTLDRAGPWCARLIHMLPAVDDPDVDWRSFFATVTFTVPAPGKAR